MAAPILILSNPRTGSTLLRLLLDTHPAICSPGELALGRLCDSLYPAVEATLGPLRADETIDARRRRCLAETRRIIETLMQRYCAAKGKPRWCEKSTLNVEFLEILESVFPDARYLCLHRHGLDVVHSSIEMYGASPWQMQEYLRRHDGHVPAAWIDRWCDYTERLLAFEAARPDRALRVIYERLVGDPEAALTSIFAFVGVPGVPGLAEQVFAVRHDLGRGDPKIARATRVDRDRVGKGRHLEAAGIPERLRDRLRSLLDALGYPREIEARSSREDAAPRADLTSVAELFADYFPRQLARFAYGLASSTSALGIRVTGAGGGAWTIEVDGRGTRIVSGIDRAPCAVTCESTDLLDVVNRRITVADFRGRVGVQGDLRWFDRPLSERVMWVLFGDDLRPQALGADRLLPETGA